MTWVLEISRGQKGDKPSCRLLESHHPVCRPGVPPKGEKERKAEGNKSEAFKDRGSRRLSGKEGVKGEKRGKEMEGRAAYKLQKAAAAAASPDHSADAFVPRSLLRPPLLNPPPRLLLYFRLVSLVIQCERSGGYQSHRCLLQTSKPGAPVHPSAPIIISARPQRKASYTGGEIFDLSSLQGSTVTQTTGALRHCKRRRRWEGGRGSGRTGGGRRGAGDVRKGIMRE